MIKRLFFVLVIVSIMSVTLPAVVLAQTGGPGGGDSGLCPDFLLDDVNEDGFTTIIDLIGYGPEGGRRVGVGCANSFKTISLDTQAAFGATCSAVVPYMMNSQGQLFKMEGVCTDGILSLPVTANTHYFFYTFPGIGARNAQELVELSVEL